MRRGEHSSDEAEAVVLRATGRASLDDGLEWIANGWKVANVSFDELLRAVLAFADRRVGRAAISRLARDAVSSELDTGTLLFGVDQVGRPERFRQAVNGLAAICNGGTLERVDDHAVVAAQRNDPFTIEALCAIAGLSYRDLTDRMTVPAPGDATASWSPSQIRDAFAVIDAIVRGTEESSVDGAIPARPLDLINELRVRPAAGWETVESQRVNGVPYEVLLAQRSAGGAWLAHRNRTARLVRHWVADRLAEALDLAEIPFLRSSEAGGDDPPAVVMSATGCGKQIGLAVCDGGGTAVYAVAFAVARDSGTARKSIGSLVQMARPDQLPVAIVVSGPGWAQRNEMAELAVAFDGRIYADARIEDLVRDVQSELDLLQGGTGE